MTDPSGGVRARALAAELIDINVYSAGVICLSYSFESHPEARDLPLEEISRRLRSAIAK